MPELRGKVGSSETISFLTKNFLVCLFCQSWRVFDFANLRCALPAAFASKRHTYPVAPKEHRRVQANTFNCTAVVNHRLAKHQAAEVYFW